MAGVIADSAPGAACGLGGALSGKLGVFNAPLGKIKDGGKGAVGEAPTPNGESCTCGAAAGASSVNPSGKAADALGVSSVKPSGKILVTISSLKFR